MKNVSKLQWAQCLILAALMASCGNRKISNYSYTVRNQSDNTVYFSEGFGAQYSEMNMYPDTTLPAAKPALYIVRAHQALPNNAAYADWSAMFTSLPTDTLSVYFFSAETLGNTSWEQIKTEYKILRRYDLSLENIKQLNGYVPYPPTPAMQNMKMYPPYGN